MAHSLVRRHPARDLHLLGLGLGRRGQRGDGEPGRGPGTRRGALDDPARADLPPRHDRRAGRRRHGIPTANQNDVLSPLGTQRVRLGVLEKFLLFSVLTSASASTQTTILPTARTTISMANWGALPKVVRARPPALPDAERLDAGDGRRLDRLDRRLLLTSSPAHILGDSITGLGFAILFYYGFTGLACAVYFRRELFKSWHRALLVGLVPLARVRGDGSTSSSRTTSPSARPATTTRRRSSASRCRS